MTYKVLTGLSYPASPAIAARLTELAGLPEAERQAGVAKVAEEGGFLRAEAGSTVSELPEGSIPWLLEQGLIEPVAEPVVKPSRKKAEVVKEEQ